MGLFDIFGTGDQTAAANAQIAGLNAANSQATGNINSGISSLNSNYTSALQPYLQNYGTATQGTTALGNALGLNGASGNASALQTLQATPGYQFQLEQGDNAVNAAAAANGTLNSGNQNLALSNYNQGLAGTTYNNYVSQLQPYLGASNAAAGGINSTYTGLGNQVAGQQDMLAGLNYQTQTGIGNANANADLAGLTASGNLWGLLGGLAGGATKAAGSASTGTALSGLGSSLGSSLGSIGSSILGIFSDERLKEDIEPVGELYDGTNVYRYRYIGDPTPRIGLMAQEVEKTRPDAVIEVGGYKAVDYGRATDYAAGLSSFLDDVLDETSFVAFAPPRAADAPKSFAEDLARFVEAA